MTPNHSDDEDVRTGELILLVSLAAWCMPSGNTYVGLDQHSCYYNTGPGYYLTDTLSRYVRRTVRTQRSTQPSIPLG